MRDNLGIIPATLTYEDILRYYGIRRQKWAEFVENTPGLNPIKGFERPKRWRRSDVERALGPIEVA